MVCLLKNFLPSLTFISNKKANNYLPVQCSSLLAVRSSVQIIAIKSIIGDSWQRFLNK